MMKIPSLFTCTAEKPGCYVHDASPASKQFVEEFTVDLSKIHLVTLRQDGSYWLNLGGTSIPMSKGIGVQVLEAWRAFTGKFIPGQTN